MVLRTITIAALGLISAVFPAKLPMLMGAFIAGGSLPVFAAFVLSHLRERIKRMLMATVVSQFLPDRLSTKLTHWP